MRVFITGASGFVGSQVITELLGAGHEVIGLVRSPDKAAAVEALGAEAFIGSTDDIEALKPAIRRADGIIHTAFNHDFSKYVENCEDDRRVIEALGDAIAGTEKRLVITSGAGGTQSAPGAFATENDPMLSASLAPRAASEEAAAAALARGANVSSVRLPQVHNKNRWGLVTYVLEAARQHGYAAYIGEGANRWPAGHVSDVARVFRLALEKGEAGARYHAVGEQDLSMREIAEAVGKRLGLPVRSIAQEEAAAFFGWLGAFAELDQPASNALTRERLGWAPTGPRMVEDLL